MCSLPLANVFSHFQRCRSGTIACKFRYPIARLSTSPPGPSFYIASRRRFEPSATHTAHLPERRHLTLWPFGASKSPSQSSAILSSASSPDDSSGQKAWTQDSWSGASGSTATPPGESLPQSAPETFPLSLPDFAQQPPTTSPAPATLHSTPTDPLTNLPIDGNHIGDLANLGLGGWGPVGLTQNLLEQIHVYAGLPWWGTVVGVSIATRVLLWPMLIRGMGRSARFFDIREQVERIVSSAKDASPEEKIKASLEARQIMKKHDASPFGSLVPMLAQAGIVFTVFLALQGMAKLPVESLKNGGVAWFRDLSVPDPTYYLPALASLVFLGGLEATEMPNDPNANRSKNIGRIFIVVGFFILKAIPAGVVLYIASNGVLQMAQGLFLRVPGVRQRLRISLPKRLNNPPPPPSS